MKNQLWSAIYDIFYQVESLKTQAKSVVAVGTHHKMRKFKRGLQADDIVKLRAEIRTKLNLLKVRLTQTLTEREVYLVLFPLVIYFDEMMQGSILQAKPIDWPPLQKELYQINNGGEMFYSMLEDILRKPETLPFIYEVFYFCLNDGFEGKYGGDVVKINEYKDKLKGKIPMPTIETQEEFEEIPKLMQYVKFPIWYYLGVVVFVIAVYVALTLLASGEIV